MFRRYPELNAKIFIKTLDKNIIEDVQIHIIKSNNRNKAYCPKTGTFIQFPINLRKFSTTYIADIVEVKSSIRIKDGNSIK